MAAPAAANLDHVTDFDPGTDKIELENAFFTGLGKRKKIALFDTLMEKHTQPELHGVLAGPSPAAPDFPSGGRGSAGGTGDGPLFAIQTFPPRSDRDFPYRSRSSM